MLAAVPDAVTGAGAGAGADGDRTPGVIAAVHAELDRLRATESGPERGNAVMACIGLCAIHGLQLPQWCGTEFLQRFMLVKDARAQSWDEAFGRPWPKGTRLKSVRLRRRVMGRIHHEVFALIRADLSRTINRDLFEEVGEMSGICLSGSVVEKMYYESINQGAMSVARWRDAARLERRVIPG